MKKILGILSLFFTISLDASKTVFVPRSLTDDSFYTLAMLDYKVHHDNEDFIFSVKPFCTYSKGCPSYFLPNRICRAFISESGGGDLSSLWFYLIAPEEAQYNSTLLIDPKIQSCGFSSLLYANFCKWIQGLWGTCSVNFLHVDYDMGLKEINRSALGTLDNVHNFCQVMSSDSYSYGKMSCCGLKKNGIDSVRLKLGYDVLNCQEGRFACYGSCAFPTGKGTYARYIFEPLVGSKHVKFGFGLNGDYLLYQDQCKIVSLCSNISYEYGFSSTEKRSFDFDKNGDWSRYLLISDKESPLEIFPAVNVTTFPVKVKPRGNLNIMTALHIEKLNWDLEFGYNFWYRQAEDIVLCQNNSFSSRTMSVLDIGNLCSLGTITSSSTAKISESLDQVQSDAEFIPLTRSHLNKKSAEQPRSMAHALYISILYNMGCDFLLSSVSCGFSYEKPHNSYAFESYSLWGTVNFDF